MSRQLYTVEAHAPTGWLPLLLAMGVSREYARGYLARESESYPSRELRVVKYCTHEEVERQPANGAVHLNCSTRAASESSNLPPDGRHV